jgi:hypothetical protein
MSQILLLYPADKKVAATQLAQALGENGYQAALEPVGEADGAAIAGKARAASAVLFIWSRALAASAVLDGWLPALRKLPNLIEVSTDGISPQEGDESRLVLLSGWRGQPFHLGWQRILKDLAASGATRGSPAPATPARPAHGAAPAAPVRPAAEAVAAAAPGKTTPPRRLAVPALAALALATAVGATAWVGSGARDGAQTPQPVAAATAVRPPTPAVASVPPPASTVATLPSTPLQAAPQAEPEQQAPATASTRLSSERPRAARASTRPAAAKTYATRAQLPIKRYSKKNSKTMRRFCARNGRSTRECRIFLRSTGADT